MRLADPLLDAGMCFARQGCGIISPDWLQHNSSYVGQMEVNGFMVRSASYSRAFCSIPSPGAVVVWCTNSATGGRRLAANTTSTMQRLTQADARASSTVRGGIAWAMGNAITWVCGVRPEGYPTLKIGKNEWLYNTTAYKEGPIDPSVFTLPSWAGACPAACKS